MPPSFVILPGYVAHGSTTNAGVVNPTPGLFQRAESPLSGAVLVADIHAPAFDGNVTYSPPNTYSDTELLHCWHHHK